MSNSVWVLCYFPRCISVCVCLDGGFHASRFLWSYFPWLHVVGTEKIARQRYQWRSLLELLSAALKQVKQALPFSPASSSVHEGQPVKTLRKERLLKPAFGAIWCFLLQLMIWCDSALDVSVNFIISDAPDSSLFNYTHIMQVCQDLSPLIVLVNHQIKCSSVSCQKVPALFCRPVLFSMLFSPW